MTDATDANNGTNRGGIYLDCNSTPKDNRPNMLKMLSKTKPNDKSFFDKPVSS